MSKSNVYCDTCDELRAEVDWDKLPDWHGVHCDKCGDVLINDADMAVYYTMNTMISLGLAKHPDHEEVDEGMTRATVSTRHGNVTVTENSGEIYDE